jgi:hypothetical protein
VLEIPVMMALVFALNSGARTFTGGSSHTERTRDF